MQAWQGEVNKGVVAPAPTISAVNKVSTQADTMRQATGSAHRAAADLEAKLQEISSRLFGRGFAGSSLDDENPQSLGIFEDVTQCAQSTVSTLGRCAEIVDDMLERL